MNMEIFQSPPTDFFSNPLVGLIGTVASIVGLMLAVYFYIRGRQIRRLTYLVNPAKAVVVQAGQASRLKATFNDKVIESDVTAAQVALWNQGNQTIKISDVLRPIVICTENNAPILEASIRKTSRDVVALELDEQEGRVGKIGVSWKILEHYDGGVIQLIYEGGTDIKIKLEGIIEGQKTIKQFERIVAPQPIKFFRISGIIFIVIGIISAIFYAVSLLLGGRGKASGVVGEWVVVAATVYLIGVGFLFIRTSKPLGPPFGY